MKNKSHMLNNNVPRIEPWGTPKRFFATSVMRYFSSLFTRCLNSHKQTPRPYCQNHICVQLLQSISYVQDSQKLLKCRLVKLLTHALGLSSLSTFQEELLVLSIVTFP